jgi:hypothetical protein
MRDSGKDKIAVSLMFIDPLVPANNHANMILFLNVSDVWYVYHYEPHGSQLAEHFPRWAATGAVCIRAILARLGINDYIYTHNQTRIQQTGIDSIQNQLTEGGYCQMISALQAYLFLLLGIVNRGNSSSITPLGTVMSPKNNDCTTKTYTDDQQLAIIRGFVIFISGEINRLLFAGGIDFSITRISEISQFYTAEQIRTGVRRPLYLYYLNEVFKFIIDEVRRGTIILLEQCQDDCGPIVPIDIGVEDFGQLNAQMSTLLGMLNGAIVLTKAAKLKIYDNFRVAARQEAARIAEAAEAAVKDLNNNKKNTQNKPAFNTKNTQKIPTVSQRQLVKGEKVSKPKKGGTASKRKTRKTKKRRKTMKRKKTKK